MASGAFQSEACLSTNISFAVCEAVRAMCSRTRASKNMECTVGFQDLIIFLSVVCKTQSLESIEIQHSHDGEAGVPLSNFNRSERVCFAHNTQNHN